MANKKVIIVMGASLIGLALATYFGALNEGLDDGSIVEPLSTPLPLAATHDVRDVHPDMIQQSAPQIQPSEDLSAEDQSRLDTLREVISQGKDNDPRIDRDLKVLSPELKSAFRREYENLPKEHRNGRGFIAFVIGRSLNSEADVDFLEQIVKEEPCLSFSDCNSKGPMYEEAEEHSTQVTLDYPQIVATRMLKQNLKQAPESLRSKISQALAASRY